MTELYLDGNDHRIRLRVLNRVTLAGIDGLIVRSFLSTSEAADAAPVSAACDVTQLDAVEPANANGEAGWYEGRIAGADLTAAFGAMVGRRVYEHHISGTALHTRIPLVIVATREAETTI